MEEKKKPSAFSVLMKYAGGHKALTYLSLNPDLQVGHKRLKNDVFT